MIIVFDTDCVLCSAWVRFILRTEKRPEARFVSAWSDEGRALAAQHGLAPEDLDQTFLVVDGDQPYFRSDAAIAILGALRAPISWLRVAGCVPARWRDAVYDVVARNRYRWFGRRDQCFVPPPEQRGRFVSAPPRGP